MSDELQPKNFVDSILKFCLQKKIVVFLILTATMVWGIRVSPFDWHIDFLNRDPVPVDAIPDIGENQQIIFTSWPGRSPQDVEDQIGYPLTVALLGVPHVKTVRSYSMFGFSSIYVIFKEEAEFYWSRSRLVEKLNSLPVGSLPDGVKPELGPDATALGQVFWYTIEGHDEKGHPTGGWDLHELRTVQDYQIKYSLLSADGVSEVASIGGFVREYQIDVDPVMLQSYGVSIDAIYKAVKESNKDVGARTIEINSVEYVIRGIGFIKSIADIENTVIASIDNIPIYVKNVANVKLGPALRRGALDKAGAEAVGGVVVVRFGENPLTVTKNIKAKIKEIEKSLPQKVLQDGTVSKLKIVPFYDRTELIYETLNTLNHALTEEILITIIIVMIMLMHFRSSLLISLMVPLTVLLCFCLMKIFKVDANIVALSGIAIAIGTIVDMGIVICDNILNHLKDRPQANKLQVVYEATSEVGSAIVTAVSTTIISFLPVFFMEAAEGKLFKPLAFTKTFALFASIIVSLTILPALAHLLYSVKIDKSKWRKWIGFALCIVGFLSLFTSMVGVNGLLGMIVGFYFIFEKKIPAKINGYSEKAFNFLLVFFAIILLVKYWKPLGISNGFSINFLFISLLIGSLLGSFFLLRHFYRPILIFLLRHKIEFLLLPGFFILFGFMAWRGFSNVFSWTPNFVKSSQIFISLSEKFPGFGKEFMPSLDEGSFLYMPTTMAHASIGEAMDSLSKQDMAIDRIPEVISAVGKLGRAESALDPAPISMFETIINYHSEFQMDEDGNYVAYQYDETKIDFEKSFTGITLHAPDGEPYLVKGAYLRDAQNNLLPDAKGHPFRLWRRPLDVSLNKGREPWAGINSKDDIWKEILRVASVTGTTSAPKLQPIAARIVMLQSGMRAPMGLKIQGGDLASIENFGLEIEKHLKNVKGVEPASVIADRIVGKPYLEIKINRESIARYGISLQMVQDVIEVAIGGKPISTTVEGRERYPIRVRYMRELRDEIDSIQNILVKGSQGEMIPLKQLAAIEYTRGPQVIKSEDTFLTGYVLFDKQEGFAEVDVVEEAAKYLAHLEESRVLIRPKGIQYKFAGSYENQIRSEKTLALVLPLALFIIFIILYLNFSNAAHTFLMFSGILIAWSGGFLLLWLYDTDWFMNFSLFGVSMRELFQIHTINLSVAVWVGFLALFGIASDDGVIMTTYMQDVFKKNKPNSVQAITDSVVEAGLKRVNPCLMTTATTIIALIPVLSSTGKGSDIMVPMAIPCFGGMLIEVVTMFFIPVIFCAMEETKLKTKWSNTFLSLVSFASLFTVPVFISKFGKVK